jgi:hypothetical protein
MPDLEFSLTFISRTLEDVSNDAIQGGRISLDNFFFDKLDVISLTGKNGLDLARH